LFKNNDLRDNLEDLQSDLEDFQGEVEWIRWHPERAQATGEGDTVSLVWRANDANQGVWMPVPGA